MKSVKLVQAIKNLQPQAQFSILADDLEQMTWFDESIVRPTNDEIMQEYNRIKDLPDPEPTVADKLAAAGLTVEELKEVLGIE